MDLEWVKIRSWHVLRTWTRVPQRGITVCGRTREFLETSNTLPSGEKSCETCLRAAVRQGDT